MNYLLGIDIGTSGVKCLLCDVNGKIVASTTQTYPLFSPKEGWTEQNPDDWWEATKKAIRIVVSESNVNKDSIISIGLSGQMHGLVALDNNKSVIRPAILWSDQRSADDCKVVSSLAGGLEKLFEYSGNGILPCATSTKLVWLRENEPQNYAKLSHFLLPKDYIRYRLTGEISTDVSDASGTGLLDVKNRCWNKELIGKLDLPMSIFPAVQESYQVSGYLLDDLAEDLGLKHKIPVAAGGADAASQTIGMKVVDESAIGLVMGTSSIINISTRSFFPNKNNNLQVICGNADTLWQVYGCQLSAGNSLSWFKNNFYSSLPDAYDIINEEVSKSVPGANKLLFFPFLNGERCPYDDPFARGVFFGLNSQHTRNDCVRAVMEGVAFGLRQIYDLVLEVDIPKTKQIILSGGICKSLVWKQIIADIFGVPVVTNEGAAEGGAYGAVLLAGCASNVFKNTYEATEIIKRDAITEPLFNNLDTYNNLYSIYSKMYQHFSVGYDLLSKI